MRFFSTILAGAALVSAAFGLTIDDYPVSVQVGQTYEIKYSPATASPTFILRKGLSGNLDTIGPISGTASNGVFKFTVPSNIPNGSDYAFEIRAGNENNFSKNDIKVAGSTATAISSAASSASASASASASSASKASSASASAKSTESADSTLTSSATISLSTSAGGNSTVALPTLSKSTTSAPKSTGATVTTGGGAPQNTGAASQLGSSPLALIFGAVAAMAYLN